MTTPDYLFDNEPRIQFVHSQQVHCTTNDTGDDGINNVNQPNVNDDNNAGLVQGDSAKNDQFENIEMIKLILKKTHWGHQSLAVHLKPRNKESEVLIVVVTTTMMKKK